MNTEVQNRKLNEELSDLLDKLEKDSNLLYNPNNISHINDLLHNGVDQNTKGQDGKTLSYYLNEKLRNILGWSAINRDILNDYIQYINFFLRAGANPNIQNKNGKTLLHYVAERNDTENIRYLLEVIEANPNIRDESRKAPFEYITERKYRQAIKKILFGNSNSEKAPCDNNQTISTESSNCNTEDKDSSCSSSDYFFLKDSLSIKLEIPLATNEQKLINKIL